MHLIDYLARARVCNPVVYCIKDFSRVSLDLLALSAENHGLSEPLASLLVVFGSKLVIHLAQHVVEIWDDKFGRTALSQQLVQY